jgi:hypothetical protein
MVIYNSLKLIKPGIQINEAFGEDSEVGMTIMDQSFQLLNGQIQMS